MPHDSHAQPLQGLPHAEKIRAVTPAHVGRWLSAGWADMKIAGWVSPAYGLIFVVIGLAITLGLVEIGMPYLITPMIGGFLLVAPLLAVGLYEMSRRIGLGQEPRFGQALLAWRRNSFHILTAGLILMLFLMIWARLAVLIFALSFPYQTLSLGSFVEQLLTWDGLVFALFGAVVGGVLALLAFVSTVVSLPLMLDRKVDFFTAALISALVVVRNPWVMLLWAGAIALVTFSGILAGFFGLAVSLPLIGHASWHAYRDLVIPGEL